MEVRFQAIVSCALKQILEVSIETNDPSGQIWVESRVGYVVCVYFVCE
jgi:hypothetical protein